MSPRRANPQLADRRREALIKAGYTEILEKGVQGTTLDAVVARANFSKGGALYYFPAKDDLLYAVLEWLFRQLHRALDEVVDAQESARAKLVAELEVLFHSAEVNRKLYLIFYDFAGWSSRQERFRAQFAAFFESCRRRDCQIVHLGLQQQQFRRVDPLDAAATIRALVDGYCLQWLMAPDSSPIETYRDRCRRVLGAYLLR